MPLALSVQNLSKFYRIGTPTPEAKTLLEALFKAMQAPIQSFKHLYRLNHFKLGEKDLFKALDGISFEIETGDVIGIIGKNGAGKSTLLKILSRISYPNTGEAKIYGSLASLLEVGTGFHPELTGRENIFLNGTFLGMTREHIQAKLDAIIDFSGIETFLDTPVKRYSSGMYVRLAFAVAAHLEADILLVDEVLAVGDISFQKKCLSKMKAISENKGKTVLFVSHNLGSIASLCNKVLYLKNGKIEAFGPTDPILKQYFQDSLSSSCVTFSENTKSPIYFKAISLQDETGTKTQDLDLRYPFSISLIYHCESPQVNIELSLRVHSAKGDVVFTSLQSEQSPDILAFKREDTRQASVTIPGSFLVPGTYYVSAYAHESFGRILDQKEHCLSFTIHDTGGGITRYKDYANLGAVLVHLQWIDKPIALPIL